MCRAETGSKHRLAGAVVLAALCLSLLTASAAHAADRVYWGEGLFSARIGFLSVQGSGFGFLKPAGVSVVRPEGTAIDSVTERIYWLNSGAAPGISFADLNGTGGGTLTIPGAEFIEPNGLAIDPVGRRIYWANRGNGNPSKYAIWSANLEDGSDLKRFDTSPATLKAPGGLALDPIGRRIYWVNSIDTNPVSFAELDSPGHGEDLQSPGAPVKAPKGLAVDPISKRVFWANLGEGNTPGSIAVAKLDGSGGSKLDTSGAEVSGPRGVAIDPFAGRVYWAQGAPGNPISFASTAGGNGDDLETFTLEANFPLLRVSPRSTAPPEISGGSQSGATLTCSKGTWAPDLVSAFYYDAAKSFTFQWSRDGVDIAGASSETLSADAEGDYRCAVSANNESGSTVAMSAPHQVGLHPSSTNLACAPSTLTLGVGQATCTATVSDPAAAPSALMGVIKFSAASTGAFSNAGGCTLAGARGGKASCQITYTPRAAGPDTITAAYQGDSLHRTSEGTNTLSVSAKSNASPPNTAIKRKPRARAPRPLATFSFAADQPGSSFQCKLDKSPFKPCRSPFKHKVKPGRHSFAVRAVNSAGVADPTPASYRWRVLR